MAISLTPDQEAFVARQMATGAYDAPYQVIEEAFHLLDAVQQLDKIRLEQLRKEIAVGIEQADRGELVELDMEEIKAEARRQAIPSQKAG
jgi:antitoxin ParD1/3/4